MALKILRLMMFDSELLLVDFLTGCSSHYLSCSYNLLIVGWKIGMSIVFLENHCFAFIAEIIKIPPWPFLANFWIDLVMEEQYQIKKVAKYYN